MVADRRGLVVVAHARSGSNCLVEMLNLALPRPVLNEPFNESFTTWSPTNPDFLARVIDLASLSHVVDDILSKWSGLKILSYQLDLPLLEHLVLRPDVDVIFLRRQNLLETAVSNLIALQTALWKTWDAEGDLERRYESLKPIPIEEIRAHIEWTNARLDDISSILASRTDGRVLRLIYEDLYLTTASEQAEMLGRLWAHLGVPPPTSPRLGYYLDPAEVRMAGPSTYGRLPNIAEINAECGSDETGWLSYL